MKRGLRLGLLWLTLVLCAPVPFFLVESGREPVAALAMMLGATLALIASEGSGGAVGLAAGMLAAQLFASTAVLGVIAYLAVRGLEKVTGRHSAAATLVLAALLFAVAFSQPIYRTPFRSTGLHATLPEVFE